MTESPLHGSAESESPGPRLETRAARIVAPLLWILISGCAGSSAPAGIRPEPAPPPPLSAMEADIAALLLRLEDRQEEDAEILGVASRSTAAPVRRLAALTLGRIGGPESRSGLRGLLADQDTSVAAASAFMLGEVRDTTATGALASFLLAPVVIDRPTVVREAAGALGKLATPEARRALSSFLLGDDAASAARSGERAARAVVEEALVAAWRAGVTDIAPFSRWTRDPDAELRAHAAWALARMQSRTAVPVLLPLLEDRSPAVRAAAIRGLTAPLLAAAGRPAAQVREQFGTLAASDEDYSVRVEAIRALGGFADVETARFLANRLTTSSPHETAVTIEALGRMGPAAVTAAPPIRRIAEDPASPEAIRALAVSALGLINPGETDAWIASLASDGSWRVRAAAGARVAALRGHGDSAGSSAFEAFARDADPRVATAAIEALLDVAGPEGIPEHRTLLVELLQSPDIHLRAAVLRGFAMLGDPVTYPALLDAYDRARFDREPAAVLAALDAIAALGRNGNLTPERAFFARFPRSEDPLVRRRAAEYFPDAALAAWGEPLPVEAFWIDARYREHVALWVAPPGHPARLPRIRIETEYGPIEALLFGDLAPRTVANFLDLAYFGFFDDLEWPRVVPNFVVQGGDPRGDTYGGPGYSIRDEINRVRFGTGTLGMALDGPDTGGSQFFITLSPQPHLDGDYTVFGEVISGMDILERLLPGDRILSVREMTEDS